MGSASAYLGSELAFALSGIGGPFLRPRRSPFPEGASQGFVAIFEAGDLPLQRLDLLLQFLFSALSERLVLSSFFVNEFPLALSELPTFFLVLHLEAFREDLMLPQILQQHADHFFMSSVASAGPGAGWRTQRHC